jgi:hypothetical protein
LDRPWRHPRTDPGVIPGPTLASSLLKERRTWTAGGGLPGTPRRGTSAITTTKAITPFITATQSSQSRILPNCTRITPCSLRNRRRRSSRLQSSPAVTQSLPRYATRFHARADAPPALHHIHICSHPWRIASPLHHRPSPGGERWRWSSVTIRHCCEQRLHLMLEGRRTEPDAKPPTERLGFGHWSVTNQFPLDFSVRDNRPFSRPRSPIIPTYNKPRPRTTPGLSISVTYPKKAGQPRFLSCPYIRPPCILRNLKDIYSSCQTQTTTT